MNGDAIASAKIDWLPQKAKCDAWYPNREHDRVPREGESFVKDFRPLRLGVVELSKGRDLVLTPRQQGAPLNYFVYPYAEVDGKANTSIETSYSFRDLAAVAQR